jgi:2-polyprenyl-3-methyl-5-hydroxy-6-metoxy-1,4-benzoquinol methylase
MKGPDEKITDVKVFPGVEDFRAHAKSAYVRRYLWPSLEREIQVRSWPRKRAFDLGCGNGFTCDMLSKQGFEVIGIDASTARIKHAQSAFPHIRFAIERAYDALASRYGKFDLVVSLEVIGHCLEPRAFVGAFLDLVAPGGVGFLSTQYHGYIKNVALAVSGKMDDHFTALWDGGHIKFFSVRTLGELLRESGVEQVRISRVGRLPPLAKSMIAVIQR